MFAPPPMPLPGAPMRRVSEVTNPPVGWFFAAYDGNLTQYFEVPPRNVTVSHGAIRYIEHYNQCGPYSTYRFQVCHNYCSGRCKRGVECTYLHVDDMPSAQSIHVLGGTAYDMMPAGCALVVHTPHGTAPPQVIPSEKLIRTHGAEVLMQGLLLGTSVMTNSPMGMRHVQRPQHCAHFQYRKLCNRGYQCSFIHSTIPMLSNEAVSIPRALLKNTPNIDAQLAAEASAGITEVQPRVSEVPDHEEPDDKVGLFRPERLPGL